MEVVDVHSSSLDRQVTVFAFVGQGGVEETLRRTLEQLGETGLERLYHNN